ncbi:MAG: transglutaminaseTgpA domain-containing protein, partial [Bifidobacterium sp.]|nr:transglutaminaseTgpA domain-containing protein [Bifidobacterium sp.]
LELGRWLSTTVIVLLAASLAVGGCLAVGQHRTILRDHYEPPLSPYEYASPLSGMRSYIKNHKDDVLLTVTDLPAGSTVRLAVMDRFDGNVWNLSDTAMASDSSSYRRVGTSIRNSAKGKRFTATFTIDKGLSDYWLPLAGAASSVTFATVSDADSFYYNTDTMSSIYPARTRDGMSYTETGVIPAIPTDKEIAKASAARISQPKAEDVPDSVDKLATAIAGGQATGGEAAQALADKLKETGWFSHGLSGDYPSNAGHGNYRIDQLLAGSAMVGDSEQYASAMALMARSLGLPSRVLLGFVPKNDEGDISKNRTEKHDGETVTEFTGNDVTAWVEIKLDGYGWVAFYPTPKETKVPDENQNLTPPNPKTLVRQPPVPLTDPLRDDNQATSKSSIGGSMADDTPHNESWQRAMRIIRAVAIYGSPLWILLIIVGLLLAVKAIALTRAREHGSVSQRVAAGWQAVTALARQSGLDIRGTRSEQAHAIAEQMGLQSDTLETLGREADYVTFSGQTVEPGQVERYWRDVMHERAVMLKSMPVLRRWRARLSLAGVVHAPGGRNTRSSRRKGRDS